MRCNSTRQASRCLLWRIQALAGPSAMRLKMTLQLVTWSKSYSHEHVLEHMECRALILAPYQHAIAGRLVLSRHTVS